MRDDQLKSLGPPTKFDNTMRSSFESCARKFYWWRRGYGYSQEIKPAYFVFGNAWGVMQGFWHDSPAPHEPQGSPIWEECYRAAITIGLRYWDLHSPTESKVDSRANLEALFSKYVETFQDEPFHMVKGAAEKGWLWPLAGTPYLLGGSTDGYLEWEGLGTLIKEDKTTSIYLNDQYVRQWRFSNQVTGYIWYHQHLTGDVGGCLMNMACKRIHKGETPQFARNIERRSSLQLHEFEKEWTYIIHKIEAMWNLWLWPKSSNPIECVGGIGRAPCLYQPLCLSDIPFYELDPLQFPGIVLDETPWEPWYWKNPLDELILEEAKPVPVPEEPTF